MESRHEEDPDTLFHPLFLSLPFILVITLLLGLLAWYQRPAAWWQVSLMMIGLSPLWDFGWHTWRHHPKFWPAQWWYRALGVLIVLTGFLPSLL